MVDWIESALDLENRRAEAISAGDVDGLSDCLAADYFHVYGDGKTGGKQAYIDEIVRSPRRPERGELTVRQYGDTVVVTGDIINRINYPDRGPQVILAMVTQVAVKQADGRLRFVSCQLTPKRELF